MLRITGKLDFMTSRAVKVYAKVWIGIKAGHEKGGFEQIFNETVPEKKALEFSR